MGSCLLSLSATDTRATILLVEDEPALLDILRYNLIRYGYNVLVAQDGYNVRRIVEEQRPCAIILDALLPGMNGFELCRILKNHQDHSIASIPLVIHSALSEPATINQALSLGASAYFTKPCSIITIINHIEDVIHRHCAAFCCRHAS